MGLPLADDEGVIAYVIIFAFALDHVLEHAPSRLRRISCSHFWFATALCAPLLAANFTSWAAAASSQSQWAISSAVAAHMTAATLVLVVPAASIPEGPSPKMQSFADAVFLCLTATAWHDVVIIKWEDTTETAAYRIGRRGLTISIASVLSVATLCQHLLGRKRFWSVVRLTSVVCSLVRLLVILLLYRAGAVTSYPPGALPFFPAAATVCGNFVVAMLMTPGNRETVAHAFGIPQRLQRLAGAKVAQEP